MFISANFWRKRFFGSRGFTLVELLVVITIIGILSAIILTSLNTSRQRARDARRVSDLRQLQAALELFYDQTGHYPDTASDCGSPAVNSKLCELFSVGVVAPVPRDPLDPTRAYSYAHYSATNPGQYHIGATLEFSGSEFSDLDRDCDSTTGNNCSVAAPYTDGFDGSDNANCNAADTWGTVCFDLVN